MLASLQKYAFHQIVNTFVFVLYIDYSMKKLVVLFMVHVFSFSFCQTLIINEISQGPSGSKEYVEFLVVPAGPVNPCQPNASCLDLRGWIFDDNNTYFTPGNTAGVGLAQGALRFSNSIFWSCIPVGTLIVVYNDADVNASLPGNDLSMNDGNCRLIIPASSALIEGNANNPSAVAPLTYTLGGWVAGGLWNYTGMANGGDSYQIYAPINTNIPAHAVSWGNNNSNTIIYFIGPSTASVYYFNSASNNPFLQNNWSSGSSPSFETPGFGNNAANIAYIQSLTNNCSPFLPLTSNPTAQNAVCACNGALNAAPSGGNGVYSYVWTNAQGQNIGNSANISNLCAGWYYLQVSSGACTVNDSVQIINSGAPTNPTFASFGPYCQGAVATSLPLTSTNGINGTWAPPSISTANSGSTVYTFTPNAGQCANNYTQSVVINANTTPSFSTFGPYCQNSPGVPLPNTSNNGISGSWLPPTVNTNASGTGPYIFVPDAGQCSDTLVEQIQVNAAISPIFANFGPYCLGDVAVFASTSSNGISGTWNPSVLNTTQPGISAYTFTPNPGICALDTMISVEVINPIIFAGNDTSLCAGNSLFLEASGGSNYQWSNGVVDGTPFTPTSSGTYTVCGTVGSCTGCDTVVVTVNPAPSASFIQDISGYDVQFLYMGTPVQTYAWDFGDGGNSSLMDPPHSYAGAGNYGVLLTVSNNGCTSTYFSEIELFAPGNDAHLINVITPNGDGINDAFDLQLEGYKKVTILILNRWGNIMQVLTGTQLTWDGMVNGNKAVEGVYFYRYDTLSFDGKTNSGHGFFHLK